MFPSAAINTYTHLGELTRVVASEVVKRIKEALALVFPGQFVLRLSFKRLILLTRLSQRIRDIGIVRIAAAPTTLRDTNRNGHSNDNHQYGDDNCPDSLAPIPGIPPRHRSLDFADRLLIAMWLRRVGGIIV